LAERPGLRRFLPPDPRTEEPYRLTPRIALRVGILGMLTLTIFAVLFLRLWALQVLNGTQYLRAAQNNQLRTVRIQAPRGPILDRSGRVLVSNVAGTAIKVWPSDLPKDKRTRMRELHRLARLVDVPYIQIARAIRRHRHTDPLSPVTVKEQVGELRIDYLSERKDPEFPGVKIVDTYVRSYPHRTLAAHLLGYVGEINGAQLKALKSEGYHLGDLIGQAGVERQYDRFLRGTAGLDRLRVDSLGRRRSDVETLVPPHAGNALRLTIDLKLQAAAEAALQYGIRAAHTSACYGCWAANGGAIVALDPRDGSIRALASYPTYNPTLFAGHVRRRALDAAGLTPRTAGAANFPILDRAIDAAYPPGSTFKPMTGLAAMEEHLVEPYSTLACTGSYEIAGQTFKNWDPFVSAQMTMPTALAASCDTYFYQLGYRFYGQNAVARLQRWASRFGFGLPTGIDLSPEQRGLLPTPAWLKRTFTRKTDPCCWRVDQLWKPGDSIQLAIGQKDLLVTPMQMARFYAAIANGGRLVTPHLLMDVELPSSNGQPVKVLPATPPAPAPESTGIDAAALEVIRQGLYEATHSSLGTSSAIFGSFPIPIAGKTGTAEKIVDFGGGYKPLLNQSWWCGYGPANDAQLVVCALIENGGHGGTAAAPAAAKVFEQYFHTTVANTTAVHSD
jgi:penicillin-binding protein 2